jgi:hypothetical protein
VRNNHIVYLIIVDTCISMLLAYGLTLASRYFIQVLSIPAWVSDSISFSILSYAIYATALLFFARRNDLL